MLDEKQEKLFSDIEILERFYNEDVVTLVQYYEIKSKIVNKYLTSVRSK